MTTPAARAAWRKSNPGKVKGYDKKWKKNNPDKVRKYMRDWARRNPEAAARWGTENPNKRIAASRRSRGLPEPTRPEPVACEICGGPPNGRGRMHLDHNHVTGSFRGWLCARCNTGIGLFRDSVMALKKAAAYVENNGTSTPL